jgi:hypothetical protein
MLPEGFRHTDETRAKMSMAHNGTVRSAETRAKMSASRMGIKYSDETRARMSEAHKRENLSPEIRAAISARMIGTKRALGHKCSDETKAKMAERKRGKKQSPEHIDKCTASRIGSKRSGETKAKLSEQKMADKNPMWKGGVWLEPYCAEWRNGDIKEYVKDRDGNICMNPSCTGNYKRLSVHHVDYQKKKCGPENLICLCISCNSRANQDRNSWMALYRLILNHKYGYQYFT